ADPGGHSPRSQHHNVRDMNGHRLFRHSALNLLLRVRLGVALYDHDTLDRHPTGFPVNFEDFARLTLIASGNYPNQIIFTKLDANGFGLAALLPALVSNLRHN